MTGVSIDHPAVVFGTILLSAAVLYRGLRLLTYNKLSTTLQEV
jgi:hypothetical protein